MIATIEKDQFINATPQRVFAALTEQAALERWFAQKAAVDMRPGGAIRFEWDRVGGVFECGTILLYEPFHRLSYTWEALSPSPTTITFVVTAQNDGACLLLTQSGIGEGTDWENYYTALNKGWTMHLTNLTDWLETGTCTMPAPTGTLAQSVRE